MKESYVLLNCKSVQISTCLKTTKWDVLCYGTRHPENQCLISYCTGCTWNSRPAVFDNRGYIYIYIYIYFFFFLWRCDPTRVMASSFLWFLARYTQWRTTVGRTPLDEWSARRRDLYLTTHNTHNRQTSMPSGGIRIHDLSRRAAADLGLRPRGHRDRHKLWILFINILHSCSTGLL